MPKINPDYTSSDLTDVIKQSLESLSITTEPVLISAVSRKVNIGNFETIDVMSALSLPLPGASIEDKEALKEMVIMAADLGFDLTSSETGQRYQLIKGLQKQGRQ